MVKLAHEDSVHVLDAIKIELSQAWRFDIAQIIFISCQERNRFATGARNCDTLKRGGVMVVAEGTRLRF